MSTYVLISKFDIQARAKRLRQKCFYVNTCPYFKISYTSSREKAWKKMFLCQHMSLFQNFIYKLRKQGNGGREKGGVGGKGGGRIGIVAENKVGLDWTRRSGILFLDLREADRQIDFCSDEMQLYYSSARNQV